MTEALRARFAKMRPIHLDWMVEKDGEPICTIHSEGSRPDMFWREYHVTLVPDGPSPETLSDDDYWADCKYVIRHTSLPIEIDDGVIIRAVGAMTLSVRGLPDRAAAKG